jgi:tyrosyl-tRNA synthetase
VHLQKGLATLIRGGEKRSQLHAWTPGHRLPPLSKDRLAGDGLPLTEAFVETGLAKSKGEARRTIEQGGAYVNNRQRTDVNTKLTAADLASETVLVLRSGKKKYALLRIE